MARVASHDGSKLALGHFLLSDPEITSDRDGKFDSHKLAGFDCDHVGDGNQLNQLGLGPSGVSGRSRLAPELRQQKRENYERCWKNRYERPAMSASAHFSNLMRH